MKQYPNLAIRVFNTPLMVEPRKAAVILAVLAPRLGVEAPRVEASLLSEQSERRPYALQQDGIATLDISGTLVNRSGWMDAMSGMSSYEQIGDEIEMAVRDPLVRGIVMRIDSYGGEVAGAFEAQKRILAVRGKKPIYAAVDDHAFSAAYLLASAADELYVTETGGVGSVGVIAYHYDQSKWDEKVGLKVTAIFAGDKKNDLSPHEPLSDEARATLQAEIDRSYAMFVSAVAEARWLSEETVRNTQAGLFWGENGINAGLATRLGSYRDAMAGMQERLRASGAAPTSSRTTASAVAADIPKPQEVDTMPDVQKTADAGQPTQPIATVPDAKLIAELCIIAGKKDMVADFIAAGKTVDQVRAELVNLAAAATEEAPIGSAHANLAMGAWNSIQAAAATRQAIRPHMTREQAVREALVANPALYEQYLAANPAQTGGR